MSIEHLLGMEHTYAPDVTVNDVQAVDVLETASNFYQLMPRWRRGQSVSIETLRLNEI